MKFILPPPFFIYIFSPTEFFFNEGVRAAGENISDFFFVIFYILSQLGKKYAYFLPILSPFNQFFSPTCCLAIFPLPPWGGGGGKTEKYTPLHV